MEFANFKDSSSNTKFSLFDKLALQLLHQPCIELTGPNINEILDAEFVPAPIKNLVGKTYLFKIGIERGKYLYKQPTFKVLKIITNSEIITDFDSSQSPTGSEKSFAPVGSIVSDAPEGPNYVHHVKFNGFVGNKKFIHDVCGSRKPDVCFCQAREDGVYVRNNPTATDIATRDPDIATRDPATDIATRDIATCKRKRQPQTLSNGNFDALVDPRLYDVSEMTRLVTCASASVRTSAKDRPKMILNRETGYLTERNHASESTKRTDNETQRGCFDKKVATFDTKNQTGCREGEIRREAELQTTI
ncbi:hypothetical protein Bca101_024798 [Brassica carinata]